MTKHTGNLGGATWLLLLLLALLLVLGGFIFALKARPDPSSEVVAAAESALARLARETAAGSDTRIPLEVLRAPRRLVDWDPMGPSWTVLFFVENDRERELYVYLKSKRTFLIFDFGTKREHYDVVRIQYWGDGLELDERIE